MKWDNRDTYSDPVGPTIDSNWECDIASNAIICNCHRSLQDIRVVETPYVRPNCDAKIEELSTGNAIIRDNDIAIVPTISLVNEVDPAKC